MQKIDLREVKKIAIFCLSGMGNILLFTPTLKLLHQIFPKAEIQLITIREANYQILKNCPFIKVIYLKQKKYNGMLDNLKVLLKCLKLRKENYDLSYAIFPSNRLHYNIISFYLGAKHRLSFKYDYQNIKTLSFLNNHFIPLDHSLHDVEQNAKLISFLCGKEFDVNEYSTEFWSSEADRVNGKALFEKVTKGSGKKILAYHPVCFPDMLYKRWPLENFACLIDKISEQEKCHQVLIGTDEDRKDIESIVKKCKSDPITLIGKPLLEIAEFLKYCTLMISNDSGLMHLAVASGTKALGLYGPTMDSRTRPWGDKGFFIASPYRPRPCRKYPFSKGEFPKCCKNNECMRQITPDAVLAYIKDNIKL